MFDCASLPVVCVPVVRATALHQRFDVPRLGFTAAQQLFELQEWKWKLEMYGCPKQRSKPSHTQQVYLFWVKILQVMQREDRLKSFPEGLKLPGDPFIQSPVNYQLQQKKPG